MVVVKNKILVDHKPSSQFEIKNCTLNNSGIVCLVTQQLFEVMDL